MSPHSDELFRLASSLLRLPRVSGLAFGLAIVVTAFYLVGRTGFEQ